MAKASATSMSSKALPDSDPDDYMSMIITEPVQPPQKETYTQRRIRKEREVCVFFPVYFLKIIFLTALQAEKKSRALPPSEALEDALSKSMSPASKGFQMLSKLGYKPGSKLGALGNENGMLEPVILETKEGREGLGMANEKKRKFREEAEKVELTEKVEQEGYRERVGREREVKRLEGLVVGAMKILEELEGGDALDSGKARCKSDDKVSKKRKVNVLYRGLVRQRSEKEREQRLRYNLLQSLSKNASYQGDPEDEQQDRLAWGAEEEELEDDSDEELEAFEVLEPSERLERLVKELREKFLYCFWCKYRYESEEMDGCPGTREEDHD